MNSNPQLPPADPLWDNDIWEPLLAYIARGQVIPIVGPALSIVEVDGKRTTMDRYIAGRLADELEFVPGKLPEAPSLNDVVSQYLRGHAHGGSQTLYWKIAKIVAGTAGFEPPRVLAQLAEITHFKLFVTTALDRLLESAINKVRFKGKEETRSIAYVPKEMRDIEVEVSSPTVYYLLGKPSEIPYECVISDEDLLEYICALQNSRPENLFERLKINNLLILGENFSDWLARLFLYTTKRQRLSDPRDPRGVLEILADESTRADPGLVRFLTSFSPQTKVFSANAPEFIDELWQRWTKKFGSDAPPPAPKMPSGAIFISYAREDLAAVTQLKAGLEKAQLSVWFDKDQLSGGDDYDEKIRENIKECAFFVPVLSRNTESQHEAFFRKEWKRAVDRTEYHDSSIKFIVPVIVDGMSRNDLNHVPPCFMKVHIESLKGGEVTNQFVNLFKRRNSQ